MSSCGGDGECGNHSADGSSTQDSVSNTTAQRVPRAVRLPDEVLQAQPQMLKGRKGDPITKDKFLQNFVRSFRAHYNMARLNKEEKVVCAFSGGFSSRVLLQLLYQYATVFDGQGNVKKKLFYIDVVFVDATAATMGTSDEQATAERAEKLRQLTQICVDTYDLPLHVVKLESLFEANGEDAVQALCAYLASYKTLSAREDALRFLVQRAIVMTARRLNATKVFSGENATTLATRVVSDMAKGRGFAMPDAVATLDEHSPGVTMVRPMKDLLVKEIVFYCHLHGLKAVFFPTLTTAADIRTASVDRLVENFIATLQQDFPSTVHTIMRTTEKLKTNARDDDQQARVTCVMCGCCLSPAEAAEAAASAVGTTTEQLSREQFSKLCCYGCKRMLSDKSDMIDILDRMQQLQVVDFFAHAGAQRSYKLEEHKQSLQQDRSWLAAPVDLQLQSSFPSIVQGEVDSTIGKLRTQRVSREQMRSELSEFILDDDTDGADGSSDTPATAAVQ